MKTLFLVVGPAAPAHGATSSAGTLMGASIGAFVGSFVRTDCWVAISPFAR